MSIYNYNEMCIGSQPFFDKFFCDVTEVDTFLLMGNQMDEVYRPKPW